MNRIFTVPKSTKNAVGRFIHNTTNALKPSKSSTISKASATTSTTASILGKDQSYRQVQHNHVNEKEGLQSHRQLSSLRVTYSDEEVAEEGIHLESNDTSPSHLSYVSDISIPISSKLRIVTPREDIPSGIWPVYRVMDENGILRQSSHDGYKFNLDSISIENFHKSLPSSSPENQDETKKSGEADYRDLSTLRDILTTQYPEHEQTIHFSSMFQSSSKSFLDMPPNQSQNTLLRCHRVMIRLRQMDDMLLNAQRQGRISFYLTCRGEEAVMIGSASALQPSDFLLPQYREQGLLMWRGFTLEQFTNQCCGNELDLGRGRQMPIHYGSRALNYLTVSSPLGTQIPQAVGIAYKLKLDVISKGKDHKGSVAAVYFGEGASSTGDFHSACNFAATLKVPVLFFCRNNGYAISTSTIDQFASDGVVCKAKGYGMAAIRVDGNDIIAMHAATKAAREYALKHMEPVLIEAITYRQGHHSSSDDSTQYRPTEEVQESQNHSDPMERFNQFLIRHHWMKDTEISDIEDSERRAVLDALEKAEARPGISLDTLFQDVYHEMPSSLQRQERELQQHMEKYSDKYT